MTEQARPAMRVVLFCHSLISDWNHGNAHFLRGIAGELLARGHDVRVFEPRDAWSVENLVRDAGPAALDGYRSAYPDLMSTRFDPSALDLDEALDGADLVLVHEWNTHALVARIGEHRARSRGYALLFHDTHHRSVSGAEAMAAYDLERYDGVLAFGEVIRERYVSLGWARRAWTWHEAADTRVFHPRRARGSDDAAEGGDLVWVGNWGDGERSEEITRYLIDPVSALGLRARVHGVRYPDHARERLARAGIDYAGWLPNYRVPDVFSQYGVTVHLPRRPYADALPGIPTIRVFEALACGIPLVSSWWDDSEQLFRAGHDYLVVRTPDEMQRGLRDVLSDPARARSLAAAGRAAIAGRHTCAHRVTELMDIVASIQGSPVERAAIA
jgi:spore maturation protein CgeB